MRDDKLRMVADDTNNHPFEALPEIDPVLEDRLMREIDAVHRGIWDMTARTDTSKMSQGRPSS